MQLFEPAAGVHEPVLDGEREIGAFGHECRDPWVGQDRFGGLVASVHDVVELPVDAFLDECAGFGDDAFVIFMKTP